MLGMRGRKICWRDSNMEEQSNNLYCRYDNFARAYNVLASQLIKKNIPLHFLSDVIEAEKLCLCEASTVSTHRIKLKISETPVKLV
jgi:hypothetical protein